MFINVFFVNTRHPIFFSQLTFFNRDTSTIFNKVYKIISERKPFPSNFPGVKIPDFF